MSGRPHELLAIYLHDHLAGSLGGKELVSHAERAEATTEFGPPLRALREDIQADREQLIAIIAELGMTPRTPLKESAAWVGEKMRRLKPNGRLLRRSPLTRVVELETLQMAVNGKRGLWQSLIELAPIEPRLARFDLTGLLARADDQIARIRELHDRAAVLAFASEARAAE